MHQAVALTIAFTSMARTRITLDTLETIGLAAIFLGFFLFGLRTGRMPGGLSYFAREENDWAFWFFGVLYLGMASVVIYVGFFEAKV